MYRCVETSFWDDPKFDGEHRDVLLLAQYLITNPESHVSGLYILRIPTVIAHLRMKLPEFEKPFEILCKRGFCQWDEKRRVVFVVNMLKRQRANPSIVKGIDKHLKTLFESPLIISFYQKYSYLNPDWGECATRLLADCSQAVDSLSSPDPDPVPEEGECEGEISTGGKKKKSKDEQIAEIRANMDKWVEKFPTKNVPFEFDAMLDWHLDKGKTSNDYAARFRNWLRKADDVVPPSNGNSTSEPEDPVWLEIRQLRAADFQCLRQEAMPYARKKSQCGDKRDPPEVLTQEYMIQIYKAQKDKLDAD